MATLTVNGGVERRERPTSEILKDIVASAQEIIRSEMRLAKVEIKEEGKKAVQAGVVSAVAAVLGLFGLGFLLLCAMFALAIVMPLWLAALIIGVVLVIPAGGFAAAARARWRMLQPPEKTIGSLKEDAEWLKRQTRS